MKELLRGESTISLEAAVLKCPNAELYLYLYLTVVNLVIKNQQIFNLCTDVLYL
jgi:hypothetical protein